MMIPSLFIAHGSPMLAISDTVYTRFLRELGRKYPNPRAIVVFSAHWISDVQYVSEVQAYDTIHDFGGFPKELYRIQYPAKGDLEVARQIQKRLTQAQILWKDESQRGLDHGAWVILRCMYPKADIPVVAMSINPTLEPQEQFRLGEALSQLREQNILVIGSGATIHNLSMLRFQDENRIDEWALTFDDWLFTHLSHWNVDALFAYETLAPYAKLAVPPYGNEHFVPLIYAMGVAGTNGHAVRLHSSFEYGNLSNSVWQFTS